MNIKLALCSDRIGPDIFLTHWMLHSKTLGRWLAKKKLKKIGENSNLRPYVTIVGGKSIEIGNNVTIRSFTQLHAGKNAEIIIEDDVLIAPGVFMTTNQHNYNDVTRPIRVQGGSSERIHIKSGAWIAANAVILKGITVGRNSVVAAGAVVTKDVPDFTVVGGVPAKLIKDII